MLQKTKILIFGTFDYLHYGHLAMFKEARGLTVNPYLIVSIATDKNVVRIKRSLPSFDQARRLELVGACNLVDEVVVGAEEDYIAHIKSIGPDIIALGYDQVEYTGDLIEKLSVVGVNLKVTRLLAYNPEVYKTSKYKKA